MTWRRRKEWFWEVELWNIGKEDQNFLKHGILAIILQYYTQYHMLAELLNSQGSSFYYLEKNGKKWIENSHVIYTWLTQILVFATFALSISS